MSDFTKHSASGKVLSNLDVITCPVCLEIFDDPVRICCGHSFCDSCLVSDESEENTPICPSCKASFDPEKKRKAHNINKMISTYKGLCVVCNKQMALSKLQVHQMFCSNKDSEELGACGGEPVPEKSVLPDEPNRITFKCPYCSLKDLNVHSLRDHCSQKHVGENMNVVCPVCASMPWGDPKKRSANFIVHLNLRHKFEYEFFVDYNLDDAEAMEKALEASLTEF
ncbi:RING finger protein 166-like [Limulus polyphemus]|uniref:RING finger protein 166-like n=1 Tax=Limulus polyphemus TaxID=6850 RepID=A0ABM1BP73_LIMPO|nr:RING finger protein 166-like [Limulus polyphemus]